MRFFRHRSAKALAVILSVMTAAVSVPYQASALVTDPAGDYDNFAKALQYSLHFYDANMCGPDVEDNSRFRWRANCHTYDSAVPLIAMDMDVPIKERVGTNLSEAFIKEHYDILNTGTEDGTVDVSGGYHDASASLPHEQRRLATISLGADFFAYFFWKKSKAQSIK